MTKIEPGDVVEVKDGTYYLISEDQMFRIQKALETRKFEFERDEAAKNKPQQ